MHRLRTFFLNLNLPSKVFLVFTPLVTAAVALIVYLNYTFQEEQTIEQAQGTAVVQAMTIRESLVNMMTENERVDDEYLERIKKIGEVQTLEVLFRMDSLHLDPEYLTANRIQRLQQREMRVMHSAPSFASTMFSTSEPRWYLTCSTGEHNEAPIASFQSRSPLFFSDCDRLDAVIPFPAERKCRQCHFVQLGNILGAVHVKVSLAKTAEALKASATRSLIIFAVFSIIAVGIGVVVFRRFVSRPLDKLMAAIGTIGSGNLEQTIATETSRDEFGKLASAFNTMSHTLKEAQHELLLKERLSLVGQMASSIVHDLRGPMTAISVGVGMLKDEKIASKRKQELFTQIHSALDRMNGMMQELLDYSRGQITLNFSLCDVTKFVEEIATVMKPYLEGKNIRFEIRQEFNGTITVDEPRLHRALLDILHNAEDAMPNGGTIRFDILPDGEYILFRVEDKGKGIPEEIKDRIFEPFVTAGKQRGTGLGLAIVKKVVDQHRGKIWFESRPNAGTTFYIQIPALTIG